MKEIKILIFLLFLSFSALGQDIQSRIYRGFKDSTIVKIERISGGFGSFFTDCFLDSISHENYSGLLIAYVNSVPQDSLTIFNGKAYGLMKEYRYNMYSGYSFIGVTYVFDTEKEHVEVSIHGFEIMTDGIKYINIRYESIDSTSCSYGFEFKKRKIKINKTQKNKTIVKHVSDRKELEFYMKNQSNISDELLQKCKELNVFDEKFIEPRF